MLKEHKVALAEEVDLKTITNQLEKEELERHQQRVKEIICTCFLIQCVATSVGSVLDILNWKGW